MASLYEDLAEKIRQNPGLTKRGGARADLGLLLLNAREALFELWTAANGCVESNGEDLIALRTAVEKLRPIFGDRSGC